MDMDAVLGESSKIYDTLVELAVAYTPKVLLAILTLFVGLKLIKMTINLIHGNLEKRGVDESLGIFLGNLTGIGLKLALGLAVIDMIGIKTTSFIAMLGAAGLAVGLALQGSLSNFAGGVLILLFRPFKTGDYIIAQGEEGTVQKIDVFNTWLNKLDNRRVILPNGALASGAMINVTAEETRRVDLTIGVEYGADIEQVKKLLLEIADRDPRVLKDPEPMARLKEMADSSLNFAFRIWVNTPDYWDVYWDTMETTKKELDKANISIPFPQRDVHLYKHDV